jgi:lipopolysaccharide transport system permease protein
MVPPGATGAPRALNFARVEGPVTIEIKPGRLLGLNLRELWLYRELFYFLTWRDIKVRYKQTVLGLLWAFLQPFLLMVVLTLFLSEAIDTVVTIPYPVFLFSGLLFWQMFTTGISGAANSTVANARIIQKIYFPRLIIPASAICVSAVDFLVGFLIYLGLILYYNFSLPLSTIWVLPLSLLLTLIAAFGTGTLLSALNVKYRDFRYVVPFIVQILFFVSAVILPLPDDPTWRMVLSFNPMIAPVELMHSLVLPDAEIVWRDLLPSIAANLAMLVIGLFTFKRMEAYFADLA